MNPYANTVTLAHLLFSVPMREWQIKLRTGAHALALAAECAPEHLRTRVVGG